MICNARGKANRTGFADYLLESNDFTGLSSQNKQDGANIFQYPSEEELKRPSDERFENP